MKNLSKHFQNIKFIIAILLGIIGLFVIYKFVPARNLDEKITAAFFYFCDVWFSYSVAKHWWKMARDEKYKGERLRWLALPLDERSGWWSRSKVMSFTAILLLAILVALILIGIQS